MHFVRISFNYLRRLFGDAFFSVQRLHGFRQLVQHVSEHVAIGIN